MVSRTGSSSTLGAPHSPRAHQGARDRKVGTINPLKYVSTQLLISIPPAPLPPVPEPFSSYMPEPIPGATFIFPGFLGQLGGAR